MSRELGQITDGFEQARATPKIAHYASSAAGIFGLRVVASGTIASATIRERDVNSSLLIDMQVIEIKQVSIRAADVTAIATVQTDAANLHRIG